MSQALGIDFGTTHIRVALPRADGAPEEIRHPQYKESGAFFPSLVYISDKGVCRAGWEVFERKRLEPSRVIASIKRYIGRSADEIPRETFYPFYPLDQKDDSQMMARALKALFEGVKVEAEDVLDTDVKQIVISTPSCFEEAEHQLISSAAQDAGFQIGGMIQETLSAGLAYSALKKIKGKYAVYSLGGGYFEVAILDFQQEVLEKIAIKSAHLGGEDIDWRMARLLLDEMNENSANPQEVNSSLAQLILEESRKAIFALSSRGSYDIKIKDPEQKVDWTRAFSRYELAELTRDIVERTFVFCQRALRESKLDLNDLDGVILVGGATRMPIVKQMCEEFFRKETLCSLNPDLAVVWGAALQLQILRGERRSPRFLT